MNSFVHRIAICLTFTAHKIFHKAFRNIPVFHTTVKIFTGSYRHNFQTFLRIIIKMENFCSFQNLAQQFLRTLILLQQFLIKQLHLLSVINIQKNTLNNTFSVNIFDIFTAANDPAISTIGPQRPIFKRLFPLAQQYRVHALIYSITVFRRSQIFYPPGFTLPEFFFFITKNPDSFHIGILKNNTSVSLWPVLNDTAQYGLKQLVIIITFTYNFYQLPALFDIGLS